MFFSVATSLTESLTVEPFLIFSVDGWTENFSVELR